MSAEAKNPANCKNCPAWPRSAFAGLSDAQLAHLEEAKEQRSFARGEAFSRKGRPVDEIFCLRSGSAKVTLEDSDSGRQSVVKLVGPGDMLGYRCIFSRQTYRGTASALTESVACRISSATVFGMIKEDSDLAFEFLRRMGEEVASAEHHHHSFCQKNVRERLAEGLLLLNTKFGEFTPRGWRIGTRLTRTELSNWIGASRETVIRAFSELIQEKLVLEAEDALYLVDLKRLRAIAAPGAEATPCHQPGP